ncbi:hypothetical protein Ocin01_17839 [Orchesella cincta]|uniref:Uncharacterized protein n=1 Tax=Orchesella cincta TaxID=48709 RepID=A0A1D2M7A0_ORCCI|nr:hypothetical protein Ocin01_17839 [Orchesella cincta]
MESKFSFFLVIVLLIVVNISSACNHYEKSLFQRFGGIRSIFRREAAIPPEIRNILANSPVNFQDARNQANFQELRNPSSFRDFQSQRFPINPIMRLVTPPRSGAATPQNVADPSKKPVMQPPTLGKPFDTFGAGYGAYHSDSYGGYGPPPTDPPVEVAPAIGNTDPVKTKHYGVKTTVYELEDGEPRRMIYTSGHTLRAGSKK